MLASAALMSGGRLPRHTGRGNDLPGVKGTAWAAYNAVTEYTTWERGNSQDARLEKVWLESGSGSQGAALPLAIDTFLKN